MMHTHNTAMGNQFPLTPHKQIKLEQQATSFPHLSVRESQPLPSLQQQLMQPPFVPITYQTPSYQYMTSLDSNDYGTAYPVTSIGQQQQQQQQHAQPQSHLPAFQTYNKEYSGISQQQQQQQQNRYQGPTISPLSYETPGGQFGRPIFQLPSQSGLVDNVQTIDLSNTAVTRAIEAAEAFVAKEAGHVPRRRRKDVNPKTEASYVCHICGKGFNRPYNLKSHQKTHSTEKPFPCKFCSKPFARSHDRKRHEKSHEGEKRFKCGGVLEDGVTRWGCNRRFARADALGRHFRTETGWSCVKPLMMEAREQEARNGTVRTVSASDPLALLEDRS